MPFAWMRTTGLAAVQADLAANQVNAMKNSSQTWWIGTVVSYAPYTEFGTSKMPERPWFRTAQRAVAAQFGAEGGDLSADKLWTAITLPAGKGKTFVALVAFALEREAKKQIVAMGVIDTGNLRGSVAAGGSRQAMRAASRSKKIK